MQHLPLCCMFGRNRKTLTAVKDPDHVTQVPYSGSVKSVGYTNLLKRNCVKFCRFLINLCYRHSLLISIETLDMHKLVYLYLQ